MRGLSSLVAVGLSLSASAWAEQADPVTLYGLVFLQMERVEGRGATAPILPRNRLTDQSSRLGVRGEERLAGDVRLFFQLETFFPADQALLGTLQPSYTKRDSGVGMATRWGTLMAGRFGTALEATQSRSVDPFGDVGLPGIRAAALNQGRFGAREGNVVEYKTPNYGGFELRLNHAAGETSPNSDIYSTALTFEDKTTYLSAAFEKHRNQAKGEPATTDEEGIGIGGWQGFGRLRLGFQAGAYRRPDTVTQKSYMLGIEWRARHNFLASYQRSRGGDFASAPAQPRCDVVGLGYRYHVSPKTFLMAQYARIRNQAGKLCNFALNPLNPTVGLNDGQELRGAAMGLRTRF